jgi:hypothetical protein
VARPRKTSPTAVVSGGQASYVLERLLKDRRVSPKEIARYVAEMDEEISELESRLRVLRKAQGELVSRGQTGVRPKPARGRRPFAPAPAPPPTGPFIRPRPTPPKPRAKDEPAKGTERAKRVTSEVLASRQLQGRYIALVRRFPKTKRHKYAEIAKTKGREAAVKEMQAARKK